MPKAAPILDDRVAQGYELRRKIADLLAELEVIQEAIIARGAGQYVDDEGNTCTAVAAVAAGVGPESYTLPSGQEEKARSITDDKFPELFERTVVFTPKKGFADRADALLTPARKRDILALCLVPGKAKPGKGAYLIWK